MTSTSDLHKRGGTKELQETEIVTLNLFEKLFFIAVEVPYGKFCKFYFFENSTRAGKNWQLGMLEQIIRSTLFI